MKRIIVFLLVLFVSVAGTARAQFKFLPDERSRIRTGSDIQPTSGWPYVMPAEAQVPEWTDLSTRSAGFPYTLDYEYKSVVDMVTIGVDHYKRDVVAAFRYKVSLTIDYKTGKTTGGGYTTGSSTTVLYLSYDPDSLKKYNDLSVFKFNGAHAFKATITDVQKIHPTTGALSPLAPSEIAANFFIETKIYSQRYDKKNMYLNAAACEPNTEKSKLFVSCYFHTLLSGDPSTGTIAYKPAAYELEWTYVDDYDYNMTNGTSGYGFTSSPGRPVTYDFRKNSTRVQLDAPFYAIPLIYEHGAVVFRFRSLRPKLSDYEQIEYGNWTLADNGSLSVAGSAFSKSAYIVDVPHAYDKFNWQYTVNFAEQGKHKQVINYFDGSLKDRQTQTMINSDAGKIIAVEKVYDYEGRPSIVSLPTPVDQSGLYYRGDILTRTVSGKAYKAEDFDGLGCSRPGEIPGLSAVSMANIYYSALNPDKTGMQKFVPDAEGYPMVHTVYSPDNTNKVEWQGGAGKEQQLVKGRGTRYEYVRATQPELDKFLGTEVGYDRFYPKQIVTDPNGQSSYSILNPQGKVVLSGLQSDAPNGTTMPIQQLSNFVAGQEVCSDLLKNAEQDKLRNGLQFYSTYYNDGLGRNTLSYSVKTFPYFTGCSGQYLWATGDYSVDVTDDCGAKYTLLSTAGQVRNPSLLTTWGSTKATDAVHGSGYAYTRTNPVLVDPSVPKGKILIDKKITFSEFDIRNQVRGFVKANEPTCFRPEEFFVRKAVEATEFPCAKKEEGAAEPGDCEGLRQQMIDELFPDAKYGKYQYTGMGKRFAGQAENSIFSIVEDVDPAGSGRMAGRTPQCGVRSCNSLGPCDGGLTGCACTEQHLYPLRCCDECVLKECACILFPKVITSGTSTSGYVTRTCSNLPEGRWKNYTDLGYSGDFPDAAHKRGTYTGTLYAKASDGSDIILPYGTYHYYYMARLVECSCNDIEDTYWRKFYTKNAPRLTGEGYVFEPAIAMWDEPHGTALSGTHSCTFPVVEATEISAPGVTAYYRYQSPCIIYPDVLYGGKLYTSAEIKALEPQAFIRMFNREMAEALLSLHPEYCKLLNCELSSADFEQVFAQLETYQEAEVAGMFTLDEIVAKDPLPQFLNHGAVPAEGNKNLLKYPYQPDYAKAGAYPETSSSVNLENLPKERLDVQALARMYCGAGNATELVNCALNKYSSEITSSPVYLADPVLKQRYFKELQAKYLGNRALIRQVYLDHANSKGGCAPCSGPRMTLTGDPVFKSIINYADADGDGITEIAEEDEDFGKLAKWKKDLYLGLSTALPPELLEEYNAEREKMAQAEAEAIMAALKDCNLSDRTALQNTLKDKIFQGEKMTPELLRSSIIAASPLGAGALNDLCHPFLVAYGLFPAAAETAKQTANFACGEPDLYTGLQNFMDRPEIKSIIAAASEACAMCPADPGSYTTISVSRGGLTTGNLFEKKFMDLFGYAWPGTATTYNIEVGASRKNVLSSCSASCARYIELTINSGTMVPPLRLQIFQAGDPTTDNDLKGFMNAATAPVGFQNSKCINEDLKADRFGLIAQKTASIEAAYTGTVFGSPFTFASRFFVWCKDMDLMTPAPEASALSDAINCMDIKDAMLAFQGTHKTLYQYSANAGHPYFEKVLTNYLNHTFSRKFSYQQYRELMEGCALSDQVFFEKEVAHARIELKTDAAADAFEAQINALGTFRPRLFRYKPSGSVRPVVFVDLSPINEKDVAKYMKYLMVTAPDVFLPPISDLYSTTAHYVPPANMLFTAEDCSFSASAFPAGTANYAATSVQVWENGEYRNYTLHEFSSAAGAPAPLQKAALIAVADEYRRGSASGDECKAAYAFYNTDLVRSADYSSPFRQAFLQYIQGLGSVSRASFLAAIDPATLSSALTGYSGRSFSYSNPYCSGTRNHLFVYKPNPTALEAPGYDLVKNTIISNAVSGTNMLFPDADLTYKATAPSGFDQQLAIIRKANGTYWYRFFDNSSNKLYNLYITPPAKKLARKAADYVYTGIEMGPDPNTFVVSLSAPAVAGYWTGPVYTPPLPGVTIKCTGYADFSLATTSLYATNVMLQKGDGPRACFDSLDCEKDLLSTAVLNGKTAYYQYFEANVASISKDYMNHLVNTTRDTLIYCGRRQQYQQTLYYYDRMGNLTRTVPPAGIDTLGDLTVGLPGGGYRHAVSEAEKYRDNPAAFLTDYPPAPGPPFTVPNSKLTRHNKVSSYKYNTQNQLIWQQTPDGGTTSFFYDAAGRQVFSQNTEQRMTGTYAYNLYDEQGRPTETGLVKLGTGLPAGTADPDNTPYVVAYRDRYLLATPGECPECGKTGLHPDFVTYAYDGATYPYEDLKLFITARGRNDVVLTVYDDMTQDLGAIPGEMLSTQEHLRNRVAAIRYYESRVPYWGGTDWEPQFSTFYSYDIGGNVKTITYDYPRLKDYNVRYHRVDYDYDLVSGKVNMISYNRGHPDQFYQQYGYDADNRITTVSTSNDGLVWNKDARYEYYKHGPLAKLQIGEHQVQSLEYAYTIQGWLKAINGDVLNAAKDMGQNGLSGDATYPRDVIAHALRYFSNDYKPIGTTVATNIPDATAKNLYNGNISQQTTGIGGLGTLQRVYSYDQLQRLKLATNGRVNDQALTASFTPANLYKSAYSYDKDGNIDILQRWDGNTTTPVQIDNFAYRYEGYGTSNPPKNNKLLRVEELAAATTGTDLQPGQPVDNYSYDRIGNLLRDKQGAEKIRWDRFGKVIAINDTSTGASARGTSFAYDGRGNRIFKETTTTVPGTSNNDKRGEYYVRDAGGNILAVYRTHSVYDHYVRIKGAILEGGTITSPLDPSGTVLTDVLTGYTSTSLSADLRWLMLGSYGSWVTGYTNRPISFYWDADPTLRSTLLYSGNAWIDAMRSEAPLVHRNALLMAGTGVQPLFFSAMDQPTEGRKLIQHYSTQMPQPVCQSIWNSVQAQYIPGNHVANASALYAKMTPQQKPMLLSQMTQQIQQNYQQAQPQAASFYSAVMADNTVWSAPVLRANNGPWTSGITQIVNMHADGTGLLNFFSTWSGGSAALAAAVTPVYKLSTVYDADPYATTRDMCLTVTADQLATIVSGISAITYHGFVADLVNAGMDEARVENLERMASSGDTLALAEHHIYGSSRLGVQRYDSLTLANISHLPAESAANQRNTLRNRVPWYSYDFADLVDSAQRSPWAAGLTANAYTGIWQTNRTLGRKFFELSDHLGNVLATVLDRKTGATATGEAPVVGSLYDHWHADIAQASDYYPGGMMMPGRYKQYDWSRMGFNGKSKDDEVYGEGNFIDFGERRFDTRLNRFISVDPLAAAYSGFSPYSFPGNNPIRLVDKDGNGGGDPIGDATRLIPGFVIISESGFVGKGKIPIVTAKEVQDGSKSMNAVAIGITSGNAVPGSLTDELTMLNTSGVAKVAMARIDQTSAKVENNPKAMQVTKTEQVTTVNLQSDKVISIDIKTTVTSSVQTESITGDNFRASTITNLSQSQSTTTLMTSDISSLPGALQDQVQSSIRSNQQLGTFKKANSIKESIDKGFKDAGNPNKLIKNYSKPVDSKQ